MLKLMFRHAKWMLFAGICAFVLALYVFAVGAPGRIVPPTLGGNDGLFYLFFSAGLLGISALIAVVKERNRRGAL